MCSGAVEQELEVVQLVWPQRKVKVSLGLKLSKYSKQGTLELDVHHNSRLQVDRGSWLPKLGS